MHDFREWWTEDLRRPRTQAWEDDGPGPYRGARGEDDRFSDAPEPEITEQDLPGPSESARVVKPRAPAVRAAKPPAAVARAQPPMVLPLPPAPAAESMAQRPILPASIVSVAGMTEAGVRGALGPPQEEVNKGSQKVWTYRGDGCSIQVSFFLDVTSNSYAALAHKTFDADGRTVSVGSCLQSAVARQDQER